jgi:Uma2 family endonuclease
MLLGGVIIEQHHGDPVQPEPRPIRFSRPQYIRLGELGFLDGRRVQRIFGEIVEMPRQNWPHVVAKKKASIVLGRAFDGIGWVNEQSPLPTSDSDPEPDVAVIPGRIEDYTDHPERVLLVVEISDSTLTYDTTTKAELYATAGVPDYWVLDLNGRELHVFRDPVPLPAGLGATAYRSHTVHAPTETVSPLAAPTATVAVADLLP